MPQSPYDAIADWYDRYVRRPIFEDVVLPALLDLVGDVEGLTVLDLACGQGRLARELARRGAVVTGIDLSDRLLALARSYEQGEPLRLRYVRDDAQALTTLEPESFAGAVCNMALMDIPDLAATFAAAHRVLKDRGWLVISITHPCFELPEARWVRREDGAVAREVSGYFRERFWRSDNPDGVRGKVGARHRMLSTYLNALADAGFCLERAAEPRAAGRRAEQVPGNREVPSILLIRAHAEKDQSYPR
ncbi:MAG: class I SAM-dependent methyltransferase [Chloroflexi bacterium]|nr:class I SAM-dependent methyltransferase [Chloroflexota bacterium]